MNALRKETMPPALPTFRVIAATLCVPNAEPQYFVAANG